MAEYMLALAQNVDTARRMVQAGKERGEEVFYHGSTYLNLKPIDSTDNTMTNHVTYN